MCAPRAQFRPQFVAEINLPSATQRLRRSLASTRRQMTVLPTEARQWRTAATEFNINAAPSCYPEIQSAMFKIAEAYERLACSAEQYYQAYRKNGASLRAGQKFSSHFMSPTEGGVNAGRNADGEEHDRYWFVQTSGSDITRRTGSRGATQFHPECLSLNPELEQFIAALVASGRYQSASEVVRAGLRLFENSKAVNYNPARPRARTPADVPHEATEKT